MIFPSNRVRIMVATKPTDFRKGNDSLAAMVKNELHKDPFTGTVFVFRAKKADRLKLLYWVSHCRAIDGVDGSCSWRRDAPQWRHRKSRRKGAIHGRDYHNRCRLGQECFSSSCG